MIEILDIPVSVPSGSAANTAVHTFTGTKKGIVTRIVANIPNYTNDVTTGINFEDNNGRIFYTSSGYARNTIVSAVVPDVYVASGFTVRVTTSGDIGAGANSFTLSLHILEQ